MSRKSGLLIVAGAFAAGLLAGWWLLGWIVFPRAPGPSDPAGLNAGAKREYVALTIESWGLTQDLAAAHARLQGFSPQELAAIIDELIAADRQAGQSLAAARLAAFAQMDGLALAASPPTATAAPVPTPASLIAAAEKPTPAPARLALADGITGTLRAALENWAQGQNVSIVPLTEAADIRIGTQPQPGAALLAARVYAVADRFATRRTGIALADLRNLWQGQATGDGARTLWVSAETAAALTDLFGAPAPNVKQAPDADLSARVWADANSLAVLPFDQLTVSLAALPLDGQNILSRSLPLDHYPLVSNVYVGGDPELTRALIAALRAQVPATNRDPERLTTVIMTGTTALTRTVAWTIEQKGDPAYPARILAPVLAAADITHVSNEIPFVDDCRPALQTMTFCAKPSYLATFQLAGVKIVGLTGNHLLDFGPQAFLHTLEVYDAAGLRYYGGGRNAAEASQPLLIHDHGNVLAFLGSNSFGPASDWATANGPGAQRFDPAAWKKEIAAARQQAQVVFVEHQAEETYDYIPSLHNKTELAISLDAGADVVTGVQAHQPQAIELSPDGRRIILYGLGNLFFDQMFSDGVRQELIARHTVYAGHLIQTELLTAMLEHYAQPRWATPAERAQILDAVFAASGW